MKRLSRYLDTRPALAMICGAVVAMAVLLIKRSLT